MSVHNAPLVCTHRHHSKRWQFSLSFLRVQNFWNQEIHVTIPLVLVLVLVEGGPPAMTQMRKKAKLRRGAGDAEELVEYLAPGIP